MKTKDLTRIALMTAVLCILAPISIPIGPVPLTLSTFILYLTAYLLSPKQALASTALYLLLGAAGLPVFSGFLAGISRFASPAGGYLIGYLFLVWISGKFVQKHAAPFMQILGLFLGTLSLYAIGILWLAYITKTGLFSALPAGMLLFLPTDILKILLAVSIGRKVQNHIK